MNMNMYSCLKLKLCFFCTGRCLKIEVTSIIRFLFAVLYSYRPRSVSSQLRGPAGGGGTLRAAGSRPSTDELVQPAELGVDLSEDRTQSAMKLPLLYHGKLLIY